jgi:hypothetical protein
MVKLESPIDLQSPFSLHCYSAFQPTIIDCLLNPFFYSSPPPYYLAYPSAPSAAGAGGGVVGQFSMTKSKYSSFISLL